MYKTSHISTAHHPRPRYPQYLSIFFFEDTEKKIFTGELLTTFWGFILCLRIATAATMTYLTERLDHTTAYDQFFLFGDSITQFSHDPWQGFAFGSALQNGMVFFPS